MLGKKEHCIQNVNIHYGTGEAIEEEPNGKVDSLYRQ
jgi:hypothetical protein